MNYMNRYNQSTPLKFFLHNLETFNFTERTHNVHKIKITMHNYRSLYKTEW